MITDVSSVTILTVFLGARGENLLFRLFDSIVLFDAVVYVT